MIACGGRSIMDDRPENGSPDDALAARERAILDAVRAHRGPAVLVAVNMNGMKAFNAVLGHAAGDQVLRGVEAGLARIGVVWRTGGDEFVGLLPGDLAQARDRVRAFTWLYNVRVGATDAWEFRFKDGRPSLLVPVDHIEVVCNPRCGLAEIGQGPNGPAHALELARRRCAQAAVDPGLHTTLGFAPIVRHPWTRARKLAAAGCPLCKFDRPTVLDKDLGESRETCPGCGVDYQRVDKVFVLGREESAGYL
jgi:GGDEF domain-containing protein